MKPETVKAIEPWLERWGEYLRRQGAEVFEPTSQWEVTRFTSRQEMVILHRKKSGKLTWTAAAESAWNAFRAMKPWSMAPISTSRSSTVRQRVGAILERDGPDCWLCGKEMSLEDRTIEHLCPLSARGPNHLANLVLTHEECNAKLGNLSVAEKVRMREESLEENRGT